MGRRACCSRLPSAPREPGDRPARWCRAASAAPFEPSPLPGDRSAYKIAYTIGYEERPPGHRPQSIPPTRHSPSRRSTEGGLSRCAQLPPTAIVRGTDISGVAEELIVMGFVERAEALFL